jgi:hypothetical protein
VDLRVCGDGDGDGDGDDDGGRAHAPSEMRSTAHAGTTRLTGMKQQQLGRGEWAYAGPPDCELLPLTGCRTCHGQTYCQAPAGSRLFASARRPNETTEMLPDSSASTTRASYPLSPHGFAVWRRYGPCGRRSPLCSATLSTWCRPVS